jgi:hypothetical protein
MDVGPRGKDRGEFVERPHPVFEFAGAALLIDRRWIFARA